MDEPLALAEADNARRALDGHIPPDSTVDSEQPPVAAEPDQPETEQ
jgi:hypothetical protein